MNHTTGNVKHAVNIINTTLMDILAHDSDGSVASGHLRLCYHIQHLNEGPSFRSSIQRPFGVMEQGHCEPIHLLAISSL